jgi:hypothetical protein
LFPRSVPSHSLFSVKKINKKKRRTNATQSAFQGFDLPKLKEIERSILNEKCLTIFPQITPSSFVSDLLYLWEHDCDSDSNKTIDSHDTSSHDSIDVTVAPLSKSQVAKMIAKSADAFISEFWAGKKRGGTLLYFVVLSMLLN